MFKKVRRITKNALTYLYNSVFNPGIGYVLMLHRIGPIDTARLECIEELKVSVDYLQRFVNKYKNRYDFISLEELSKRLRSPQRRHRRFICFTFDDGFKDNLTFGLPFFEKNHIPFAVFVTCDYVDRKPPFIFPFLLERIIRENSSLLINGVNYFCRTKEEKNRTFNELKSMINRLPYESFESSFKALFNDYLLPEYDEDIMMGWDDIRQLASSPLCTIGSHTVSHCRLSSVPSSFLMHELKDSKSRIEEMIGREVQYLSYPFGWITDVNEQTVLSAKESGYQMAFISHGGVIRQKDNNIFMLKRKMLLESSRAVV